MLTCATQNKIAYQPLICNLFSPLPDTEFREYLDKTVELARFAPEIITAIDEDLDTHAREKKKLRLEDRAFFANQAQGLPELDIEERALLIKDLRLAVGRPRMPAEVVFVFLMMRGFLGSVSSKQSWRLLGESMSLYGFFVQRGLKMPGVSTILDNINAVSHQTRKLIFDRQIVQILQQELDDFKMLTIDSTAVKANSGWPTDAKILTGLLMRVSRLGQELDVFGVDNFRPGWVPHWLEEMDKLVFKICLAAGKPHSKTKLTKFYRQLIRQGKKTRAALKIEFDSLEKAVQFDALAPSRRELITRIIEQIGTDLSDAERVIGYAWDRVFHKKKTPSTEKVLSLSDGAAAFIVKGNRCPVIGYKPQLVRSQNGFVTSLIVPEGNAADSGQLIPAISDSIKRTGIIPEVVSTDDGYSSAKGRDALRSIGVKVISFSGAKGKKVTSPENWESKPYREARRCRSAVESLMFTIKNGFDFGELGRRGIEAVRDEQLEKVLAYNCCRSILMEKRRREKLEKAG